MPAPETRITLRPLRDLGDAAGIAEVHRRSAEHDGVERVATLERTEREMAEAIARGEQDNWRIAEVQGEPIGYARLRWWVEGDGTWVYLSLGHVVPRQRGRGAGTHLLQWAENRAREVARLHPTGGKAECAGHASETETDATTLLKDAGYTVAFTTLEMECQVTGLIAVPPLPVGLEIRPLRPDRYLALEASVRESYFASRPGGRFVDVVSPEEYARYLVGIASNAPVWQVSWDGDEIAGQVLTTIGPAFAEIEEVSVRPAWRRRGLARALLVRALNELARCGIGRVRLHTRADSPDGAPALYASVGFRILKRFPRYRKGME